MASSDRQSPAYLISDGYRKRHSNDRVICSFNTTAQSHYHIPIQRKLDAIGDIDNQLCQTVHDWRDSRQGERRSAAGYMSIGDRKQKERLLTSNQIELQRMKYSDRVISNVENKDKEDKWSILGPVTVSNWRDSVLRKFSKDDKPSTSAKKSHKKTISLNRSEDNRRVLFSNGFDKQFPNAPPKPKPARFYSRNKSVDFIKVNKGSLAMPDPQEAIKQLHYHLGNELMRQKKPDATLWQKRHDGKFTNVPPVDSEVAKYLFGVNPLLIQAKRFQKAIKPLNFINHKNYKRGNVVYQTSKINQLKIKNSDLDDHILEKKKKAAKNIIIATQNILSTERGGDILFAQFVKNNTRERSQIRPLLLNFKQDSANPLFSDDFLDKVIEHRTIPSIVFVTTESAPEIKFIKLEDLLRHSQIPPGSKFMDGDTIMTDTLTHTQANCIVQRVEPLIMELDDFYYKLREYCFSLKLRQSRELKVEFGTFYDKVENLSRQIMDDTDYLPNQRDHERDAIQHTRLEQFEADRSDVIRRCKEQFPIMSIDGVNDLTNMNIAVNNIVKNLNNQVAFSLDQLNSRLSKPLRQNVDVYSDIGTENMPDDAGE